MCARVSRILHRTTRLSSVQLRDGGHASGVCTHFADHACREGCSRTRVSLAPHEPVSDNFRTSGTPPTMPGCRLCFSLPYPIRPCVNRCGPTSATAHAVVLTSDLPSKDAPNALGCPTAVLSGPVRCYKLCCLPCAARCSLLMRRIAHLTPVRAAARAQACFTGR